MKIGHFLKHKNRKKDFKKQTELKTTMFTNSCRNKKKLVCIEILFHKSHFVLYDFRTQTSDLSNKGKEAFSHSFNHQHIVVFVDLQEPSR